MIRSKGEAGTGNIVEAVRHLRSILGEIRALTVAGPEELFAAAKELRAPVDLVQEVAALGELPVPMFCAGGIATPADASLVMQLGAQAVFVGSGIFKSEQPEVMAKAIVEATTHYADAGIVAKVSRGLGAAMRGRRDRPARRQARRPRLVAALPTSPLPPAGPSPERGANPSPQRGTSGGRAAAEREPVSTAARSASGDAEMKAGVLALQGAFREHARSSTRSASTRSRCGRRTGSPASTRSCSRAGESTTMQRLLDTSGLRAPLDRRDRRRPRRARHLRRGDRARPGGARRPARPGPARRHRHRDPPQRLRPPARFVRGRPHDRRPARAARSRACSSGRRPSSSVGEAVEVLAEHNGRPVLAREARVWVTTFHPELARDFRLHERFLQEVA